MVQSAKAALLAGAGEAFCSRHEQGGPKGKRVITAAVAAGAINVFLNSRKKDGQGGGRIEVAESVVGGLALDYLVHGSHHKSRRGATAAGAASVNENKSKNKSRRYNSSDDDSDGEQRKRRKSISDLARAGMAKLGLGGDKRADDPGSRRDL